jgi:hypothetical protein
MKPMNDRTQLGQPRPAGSPARRQRFRIQKLEERIAPLKGGKGTHNCPISTGRTNCSS